MAYVLGKSTTICYTQPDYQLTEAELARWQSLVKRRLAGQPLAYLIGEHEFWSLKLKVNQHTLIPRADTESLVEQCLALPLPQHARVVDLGTGSGAIAMALAVMRPDWQIIAVDQSSEALAVAQENVAWHQFANVTLQQSNWFESLSGQFDLIVSNPPYIASNDAHLEGLQAEPQTALVAGPDGLVSIREITAQASHYLNNGGWLAIEHGYDQAERVRELLQSTGFTEVRTFKDLAGNDRGVVGQCVK